MSNIEIIKLYYRYNGENILLIKTIQNIVNYMDIFNIHDIISECFMKRGLTGLVVSAVMCSMAFASPSTNEPSFTGLNAAEHAVLFGGGSTAKVVALDGEEMKRTSGEFIWFAPYLPYVYTATFVGGNYLINNISRLPATYDTLQNMVVGGMFTTYTTKR